MTAPSPADSGGDVSDLLGMFAEAFPRWRIARTARGPLLREELDPNLTIEAGTLAELYVWLRAAERAGEPVKGLPGTRTA